ncbi:MarR family winged helix-turn-helix transcriptional regulator [Sphingomonas sp. RS6]
MSEGLGFLLSDVARLMRRRFDERARSHASGASVSQWRVLKILHRQPGLNQGQIAELLEVEPITCCRMIDRLEESGLVERRRDPADRRMWRIHLTDRALPVIEELRVVGGEMIEDMLSGLDAAQRETLIESLILLRNNLSQPQEIKEAARG